MSDPRWSVWNKLSGDEKIARVYDVLLDRGELTPTEIAEQLQLPRTTLYPAFEWLKQHHLVKTVERGRETRYIASSPETWRMVVEEQRVEAEGRARAIELQLPGWISAYESAHRPRVRAFQGEEGLRALRQEVFEVGGEVWEYFAVDEALKSQAKIEEAKRVQYTSGFSRGRSLFVLDAEQDAPPFFDRRTWDVRFLPKDQAPFSGSLVLLSDRAYLLASQAECMGLVIESKDVVGLLKSLYARAWEQATPWTPPPHWGIQKTRRDVG